MGAELVRISIIGFSLGAMVWNVARLTPLGRWPLFELLDILAVAGYALVPALAVAGLLAGRWSTLPWLVLPVACFVVEYGTPLRAAPSTAAPTVRALTSNVTFDDTDLPGLETVLNSETPDVVALQELSNELSARIESSATLQTAYPHRVLYPHGATRGLGLLSRYPIRDASPPDIDDLGCSCFQATIAGPSGPFHVLVAHPGPPPVTLHTVGRFAVPVGFNTANEMPQLLAVQTRIRAAPHPLLVLGDFNTSDRQPFYRALRADLQDTYRESGPWFGFTFPNASGSAIKLPPLVRIDYLWHDAAWTAHTAHTGVLPQSDHRYVVADLSLAAG